MGSLRRLQYGPRNVWGSWVRLRHSGGHNRAAEPLGTYQQTGSAGGMLTSVKDFFLVSPQLVPFVDHSWVEEGWPHGPHKPVGLQLNWRPEVPRLRVLSSPQRLPTTRVFGPVPPPAPWVSNPGSSSQAHSDQVWGNLVTSI